MTAPVAPPPPRPPIDPRILERRVRVRRDEGRRRLRLLIAIVALAAVALVAWGITRSPLLDLDKVEVRGSTHTPVADVIAASRLRTGAAMTDLREGGIARRVERLPWVAGAHVVRHWPGTVTIALSERVP